MKTVWMLILATGAFCADFSRSGADSVVTDNRSGLQWQDNAAVSLDPTAWQSAVGRCEALDLGGYDDWRLPNINELLSIVDYGRSAPAIDPLFLHTASSRYWTSTSHAANPQLARGVDFSVGSDSPHEKLEALYVRCVRGGAGE